MSKQVQLRRSTTAAHATFTGADGEITVDTNKRCLVLHDGSTPGGKSLNALLLDAAGLQTVAGQVFISGGDDVIDPSLEVLHYAIFRTAVFVGGELTATRLLGDVQTRTYAASLTHDFNSNNWVSTVTLAGDITFAASNYAPGRMALIRVKADGSARTLAFPAGWAFVGSAAPASIAANKTGILEVWCFGPLEADVVARWTVKP